MADAMDLSGDEVLEGLDRRSVVLAEGTERQRLDKALADAIPDVSRSRLKALIEAGYVAVDGTVMNDPSRKVAAGAQVDLEVPPAEPADPEPENIPIEVV